MMLASVAMADGIQWALLAQNGCIQSRDPGPASVFLRSSTPGAYTTTRTSNEGCGLLLWERHMRRLTQSMELLAIAMPDRFCGPPDITSLHELIQPSLQVGLQKALEMRRPGEEINLTILACGGQKNSALSHKTESSSWDLSVHMSNYVPKPTSVAAHVAVMGPGRDLPLAKYSRWASTRQSLENSRPSGASEIILSNDGDLLLEGSVTNFFVVTATERIQDKWEDIKVRTAPLEDGILPGVIRQLVIEVCRDKGIHIEEVAPSWDGRETWKGAFVTSSLRLVQPVGSIQRPASWDLNKSPESWQTCHWDVLPIVSCNTIQQIQELVLQRAMAESLTCKDILNPAGLNRCHKKMKCLTDELKWMTMR